MVDDITRRFVCQCLEMPWNAFAEECVRRLAKDASLDWRSVRQLVYAEELAPFLYHLTRNQGILPSDLERDCSVAYYNTAAVNTLRLRDLERVLELLGAQGVSVILLKGAALIETLYGDAPFRPMGDIDLMVRPESLPMAMKVLSAFSRVRSSPESQVPAFVNREREISFHKTGAANTVFDLHWQVFDSPFYPHTLFTNWLWESSLSFRVGNATAKTLSQEAMLLHLCGHYRIDESRKELLWLYDIASVISRYRSTMDWDLMIAKAQLYGLLLSVKRVFSRIDDEWKGLIPQTIQDHLDRLTPSRAEKAFDEWAISSDRAVARLVGVNLTSMSGWRERLRYVGSNIFPPISYMRHRYGIRNSLFVVFTYPYRWLLSLYRAVIH